MKRKTTIFIVFIIAIAGIYLNRSYAYIYDKISSEHLKSPDQAGTYTIDTNAILKKSVTYVALGDSLTAGVGVDTYEQSYPYLLAQKLSSDYGTVILKNRSIPGLKTKGVDIVLLRQVISDKPDVVTLLIGVNDIQSGISKQEFKNNYDFILKQLVQETRAQIYVVTIPFLGSNILVLPPYNYYFDYRTQEFNKVIKELADRYKVRLIDLYAPTVDTLKGSGEQYSADLFHPSAKEYAVWANIFYDAIHR